MYILNYTNNISQISIAKMKYDPCKGRGVQLKGSSAMKVFINKEADYESVLERVREDLFGSVDRQGTTPDFTVKQHYYIFCLIQRS